MKKLLILVIVLLAGAVGQRAQAQVSTDYDKSVNFSQYKTYAWCTPDIEVGRNPVYNSPLITSNIEATLSTELQKRGLTMNPEQPDLLVGFHTYTEKRTQTVANPPAPLYYPFGFRAGWRYFPYGYGNWPYQWNTGFQQRQYTEGTLVVDFVDAKSKQLVWRGLIEGAIDNPTRIEREITRGVQKIMKEYPIKAI